MLQRTCILLAIALLGLPSFVHAQKPPIRITVTASDDDGIVSIGQEVIFTANVKNRSAKKLKAKLRWSVKTVAFDMPQATESEIEIDGKEAKKFIYKMSLPSAGFAEVECSVTTPEKSKPAVGRRRIGAEVEKVAVDLTREEDFDDFWKESLAKLKAVDPAFKVEAKPDRGNDKADVFEVTMRSFGNVRVRGWLEVPKKGDGPYPVVIRVPGYGQNMKPTGKWDDMMVFSFNPRGHGNSQDDVPGKPADYWIRGLDDKVDYFYRGAYLDCVRSVDFISSRSDADQTRIAVWGGSQGGGFAFATAALDPRVDFCAADIPFLCDWHNYFKLTHWPEMDKWIEGRDERTWESTLRTLSYFDTMNMASRIKCPTVMGVGMQDQTCPPTTNFAAFNRITTHKSFKIYNDKGHGLGPKHWQWIWEQIRSEFERRPVGARIPNNTEFKP